jgi:hypothetical protein
MTTYNPAISKLDMPARIAKLPVDRRGYPIPKFVKWIDGEPDFRIIDAEHLARAVHLGFCWLCGERLGRHMAFVIGPMCAVNRITSEPPSHLGCANFAVRACPFLVHPQRSRNEADLPDGREVAGIMIRRNPGVVLIWVTDNYGVVRHNGGMLFRIGNPTLLGWFAHGRAATREEIMTSIDSGLPLLRAVAEKEGDEAVAELDRQIKIGLALVSA